MTRLSRTTVGPMILCSLTSYVLEQRAALAHCVSSALPPGSERHIDKMLKCPGSDPIHGTVTTIACGAHHHRSGNGQHRSVSVANLFSMCNPFLDDDAEMRNDEQNKEPRHPKPGVPHHLMLKGCRLPSQELAVVPTRTPKTTCHAATQNGVPKSPSLDHGIEEINCFWDQRPPTSASWSSGYVVPFACNTTMVPTVPRHINHNPVCDVHPVG